MNSTVAACTAIGEDVIFYDFICDGPCTEKNNPWRTGRGLHSCQLCLDTDCCEDCRERLKKDEITYTLCSATHPFLHLEPFKKPEEGFVVRGGSTVKIAEKRPYYDKLFLIPRSAKFGRFSDSTGIRRYTMAS